MTAAQGRLQRLDDDYYVRGSLAEGRYWSVMAVGSRRRSRRRVDRGRGLPGACWRHPPTDRVAVQVQVQARDVLGALGEALTRWRAAAAESLPAGWHVVRAEVLTLEEFERHWELD